MENGNLLEIEPRPYIKLLWRSGHKFHGTLVGCLLSSLPFKLTWKWKHDRSHRFFPNSVFKPRFMDGSIYGGTFLNERLEFLANIAVLNWKSQNEIPLPVLTEKSFINSRQERNPERFTLSLAPTAIHTNLLSLCRANLRAPLALPKLGVYVLV